MMITEAEPNVSIQDASQWNSKNIQMALGVRYSGCWIGEGDCGIGICAERGLLK